MFRLLVTLLLSTGYTLCMGQYSIEHEAEIQSVSSLTVQSMPQIQNEILAQQEFNQRRKARAPRFAHSIPVELNPMNSGKWETIGNQAIWRLVIESKTAYSLNLGFTNFHLPSSASLFIYDFYGEEKIRPFVAADNEEHEKLWTPIISSDKIIIEVNLDQAQAASLSLNLAFVNHDFLDIQKSISDACNIDVKCGGANGYPGVDDFRDQIRSIGLYTIAGVSTCTGFLINNTRQDCRPYFMTADHCNLNGSNVASMVTYWNYENSYCREPGSNDSAAEGNGSFSQFNSGAQLRATWPNSDFTLVEMDDGIPKEVNAYFCGWDISSNPPSRGTVIHHPDLEEKRISFKYSPLYLGEWGQEATPVANGNHIIVNDWDLGSTADGSSGAPLLNREGLAVGQLHGGLASCDNEGYDAFGRLFSSWTGGGAAANRLRDWLDPDNVGLLKLEGKNCVFNIDLTDNDFKKCKSDGFFEIGVTVDESFQGLVEMTFEALPSGAFAFFDQSFLLAGQMATLTVSNLQNLTEGEYSFDIIAKDQVQVQRVQLQFTIVETTPNAPLLDSPVNNNSVDVKDLVLRWEEAATADLYKLQLAIEPSFTQDFEERFSNENSFDFTGLGQASQVYFWRVKSINSCGESEWSEVGEFAAVDLLCIESSSNEMISINEEMPNVIFSPIWNSTTGTVVKVELSSIQGQHSFVGDLRFSLISPSGTEVDLIRDQCSSSRDFDIGFADDGLNGINCPITDQSIYRPIEPLSVFKGESALGEWNLKVIDINSFDGGSLDFWSLDICVDPEVDYSLSSDFKTIQICTNETYNIPLTLGGSFNSQNLNFQSNIPNLTEITQTEMGVNLTINPSAMVSPGSYPIIITVMDDFGNSATYDLDMIVILAPVNFELVAPSNNEILSQETLSLDWENVNFASEYLLSIADSETFENIIWRDTTTESNYNESNPLLPGKVYYWQITAKNKCGIALSEIRSFMVEETNSVAGVDASWIEVSPNPADEFIFIQQISPSTETLEISISDLNGKTIFKEKLESNFNNRTISVNNWPKGVYLVSVKSQAQIQVSRIVVQ